MVVRIAISGNENSHGQHHGLLDPRWSPTNIPKQIKIASQTRKSLEREREGCWRESKASPAEPPEEWRWHRRREAVPSAAVTTVPLPLLQPRIRRLRQPSLVLPFTFTTPSPVSSQLLLLLPFVWLLNFFILFIGSQVSLSKTKFSLNVPEFYTTLAAKVHLRILRSTFTYCELHDEPFNLKFRETWELLLICIIIEQCNSSLEGCIRG